MTQKLPAPEGRQIIAQDVSPGKGQKKIQAPQGNTYTRTKRSPNQPRRKTPPDTNSLHPTRRSLALDAVWKPAHRPAPDRPSATPAQQDSPHSARTGRTVSNPSSRDLMFAEGHDFSRAIKTRKKIQTPQTRPTGQEPDRPLTSLPIPPPPCESSPKRWNHSQS